LRGPWECTPIGADGLEPRRVLMPCRWIDAGLADFRGSACFGRKFGYPGKADPEFEHIWLTCDGCSGCREVRLNGTLLALAPGDSFAFDVTPLMAARNQLDVVIEGTDDSSGLWGEVALEMRKDAYLAEIDASQNGATLQVTGRVVGAAPQPLELYTLVDKHHVDYRTILPSAAGTPFQITLDDAAPTSAFVRVELIHISAIWYVVELPISHWKSNGQSVITT